MYKNKLPKAGGGWGESGEGRWGERRGRGGEMKGERSKKKKS